MTVWSNPRHWWERLSATRKLTTIGSSILISLFVIRSLSPAFSYGSQPSIIAVSGFVTILIISGCGWFTLFFTLPKLKSDVRLLSFVIAAGVLMRVLFLGSTPIYEDDWHRYLWDGATVSAGVNPYIYTPSDAALVDGFGELVPLSSDQDLHLLQELGRDNPDVLSRVNYPYVSTIYPPVAQLGFAAANHIKPFSLDAWRFVLLIADMATILLLLVLLKQAGRSGFWALLYWWNPIIILTVFNAGHMDALIAPFLLGAFLLVHNQRPRSAALCLAAAAGIKFWPLVLAPVLFRRWRAQPAKLIICGMILAGVTAALLAPMILSLDWDRSGLAAYTQSWRRNAFLFPLIAEGFQTLTMDGDLWARVFVAASVSGASLWLGLVASNRKEKLACSLLIVVALLFFLSPTGYPWYALWLFIFLPFAPSAGIGALTMTLPLYYTRYHMEAHGLSGLYSAVIVPVEFLIPLGVLVLERARRYA